MPAKSNSNVQRVRFLLVSFLFAGCVKSSAPQVPLLPRLLSTDGTTSSAALAEFDLLAPVKKVELIPALERALSDSELRVRINAACTLAHMGTLGKPADALLHQRMTLEKDPEAHLWVQSALELMEHPMPALTEIPRASQPASVPTAESARKTSELDHVASSAKAGPLSPDDAKTVFDAMIDAVGAASSGNKTNIGTLLADPNVKKLATPNILLALKGYSDIDKVPPSPNPTLRDTQVDEACRALWEKVVKIGKSRSGSALIYFMPSIRQDMEMALSQFGRFVEEAFVPIAELKSFKVVGRTAIYHFLDEKSRPSTLRFYQLDNGSWQVSYYETGDPAFAREPRTVVGF